MLGVLRSAFQANSMPDLRGSPGPIVVAFGSFGRLDGSVDVSDYDSIFVYPGARDDGCIDVVRGIITQVVSSNKALPFDHRAEIESRTFDFSASPAYPIISQDELLTLTHPIRSLQVLTEGRLVCPDGVLEETRSGLLSRLGYSDDRHTLNFTSLRSALNDVRREYCTSIIGRLCSDHRPLSNRKVLKLFALREFFYLATLFSTAEVSIAASTGTSTSGNAVNLLSSPSILKVTSFADSTGALSHLLHRIRPEARIELSRRVAQRVEAMSQAERIATTDTNVDTEESELDRNIRAVSLSPLSHYDALIQLLHDTRFLAQIDGLEPDVTTWMGFRQFDKILVHRQAMIGASKNLASMLKDILVFVRDTGWRYPLEEAIVSLDQIIDYDLQLSMALPRGSV